LLILQAAISDFWGKVFLAWQIYPAITVGYEQRKCLNKLNKIILNYRYIGILHLPVCIFLKKHVFFA